MMKVTTTLPSTAALCIQYECLVCLGDRQTKLLQIARGELHMKVWQDELCHGYVHKR